MENHVENKHTIRSNFRVFSLKFNFELSRISEKLNWTVGVKRGRETERSRRLKVDDEEIHSYFFHVFQAVTLTMA